MQVPLELTFRDVNKTESIERLVRQQASKLERVCDHVASCRVAIERPHRHQRTGNGFRVRIEVSVPPGHDVIVSRESGQGSLHDSLQLVVRGAFDAARRQVKKLAEMQRGAVKAHPEQEVDGIIEQLFDDHGFIRATDGGDVYFHRNSVVGMPFEDLKLGNGVSFSEQTGDKGPQASSVQVVDYRGRPTGVGDADSRRGAAAE